MEKDQQEEKKFLEEQIKWCKKRDVILELLEEKLYKMKVLAECSYDHELTSIEIDQLNGQLNTLKQEVHILEQQLQVVVH